MTTKNKILKLSTLKRKISMFRQDGKMIAFTNGCFDILHYGHVNYLEQAKGKDRILIIGLNSDVSVKKIKGPGRPINSQMNRAGVLAALQCVDFVVIFDQETPYEVIQTLEPDVLIKGADWKGKGAAGSDVVKARGGKVEFVTLVPNLSTTKTINTIAQRCQKH